MIRSVRAFFDGLAEGIQSLSTLGRVQCGILLFNVISTTVAINILTEGKDRLCLYIGIEFVAFTVIGLLYTLAIENPYAFSALILLQVELLAFVSASAFVGVIRDSPGLWEYFIVGSNWIFIIAFFILQQAVRKSWAGWHAYRLVGGSAENLRLYASYQRMYAAIVADLFHVAFFLTVEEGFLQQPSVFLHLLVIATFAASFLVALPFQQAMKRERLGAVAGLAVVYVLGYVVFFYCGVVAIYDLIYATKDTSRSGQTISYGERILVLGILTLTFFVRTGLFAAITGATRVFGRGLAIYFPGGYSTAEQKYLITHNDIVAAVQENNRRRTASVGTPNTISLPNLQSAVPPSPRTLIIDATANTRRLADSNDRLPE